MGEWLQSLVPWGTDAIVWVQSFSNPWLDAIFGALTLLGNEEFYLILLPFIYWCVHKRIGTSLVYLSLLSAWLNSVVKFIFKIPRPSDPRIRILDVETNPSFASGHAQGTLVNWGYLAYRFRNPVLWVVTILVVLGVGLSRPLLGAHFPQDVIGGWLIGLVVLVVYAWAEPPVARWVTSQTKAIQLVLAVGVPVLLIFLHPADVEGFYPSTWAITPLASLAGFGVGFIMERDRVRFRVDGEWWRRGLRFPLGIVIAAIPYVGVRFLLPDEMAYGLEALLLFVRLAFLSWVVAFLCPWLFVRLGLAEQEGE